MALYYEQKANTRGRLERSTSFYEAKLSELATMPANCAPWRRRADVKQISENLPYCSAFSGKEGLSAYLLFGTLVGWLVAGRFGWLAASRNAFSPFLFFFFLFRRFPRLSRINGAETGRGREGKSAGCSLMLYSEPGAPASSSILTCKLAKIKRRAVNADARDFHRWWKFVFKPKPF